MASKKSQIKQEIQEKTGADKVIAKADGTYSVRKGYFYRHGMTDWKWAEKVQEALPDFKVVNHRDVWQEWPKNSWFEAIIRPVQ